MSSGGNVTLASNVLGTIGTLLWCIQLIPQIWYNWRRKKTDGFPAAMMFLWASCAVPMGAYFILQEVNIPIQIQPQIFGFFSLVSWTQILYYNHQFKATLVCLGTSALFGGLEALLILTLRIPYNKGITWPDIVVGVFAAILLSGGLLPPYFELWKRDGRVVGFSMVVLEAGIYISHIVWRIRYRKLRKEAKASGMSIDDFFDLNRRDTDSEETQSQQKSDPGNEKQEFTGQTTDSITPDHNV
ncbi:uncharacterized protein N7483_000758 [Penicillium malachiteum]|uniref:uncharacterized protein n=1 Tax=Penicillium malachiteum TaxID=1324776 RepID=UPI0025473B67|nr:uncharacterized protein N7483_000758 [Penicillium malachiteum]KAJ5735633.1 hypothetical protein N7483_000758 [Penicillium malachiteum]